jgi:TolB-like protein
MKVQASGTTSVTSAAGHAFLACIILVGMALATTGCTGAPAAGGQADSGMANFSIPSPTVAIFDFEFKPQVPGYEALASDVTVALAEAFLDGAALRPIERAALYKVLDEQEFALSGLSDPALAARAGRLVGAHYIFLGSIAVVGDQARISGRLVDTETAEISWAGSATGDLEDIFEVEEKLARLVEKAFK